MRPKYYHYCRYDDQDNVVDVWVNEYEIILLWWVEWCQREWPKHAANRSRTDAENCIIDFCSAYWVDKIVTRYELKE